MCKFLVSAAMIGLIAGFQPVLAQDREHQDQGGPPHGQQHGGAPHGGAEHRPQGGSNRGAPSHGRGPQNHPSPHANAAMRPRPPQNRPANAMGGSGRNFSSFRNYHQNVTAARRFHAPPYRPPPGYYARRWTWGQTLPVLFWARQYWLLNSTIYALPPPPFGAVWVRVGNDALLIDQSSGMIISVSYGVFY